MRIPMIASRRSIPLKCKSFLFPIFFSFVPHTLPPVMFSRNLSVPDFVRRFFVSCAQISEAYAVRTVMKFGATGGKSTKKQVQKKTREDIILLINRINNIFRFFHIHFTGDHHFCRLFLKGRKTSFSLIIPDLLSSFPIPYHISPFHPAPAFHRQRFYGCNR